MDSWAGVHEQVGHAAHSQKVGWVHACMHFLNLDASVSGPCQKKIQCAPGRIPVKNPKCVCLDALWPRARAHFFHQIGTPSVPPLDLPRFQLIPTLHCQYPFHSPATLHTCVLHLHPPSCTIGPVKIQLWKFPTLPLTNSYAPVL